MSQPWTKEPWIRHGEIERDGIWYHLLNDGDYKHARLCVNGCANLNPVAYRECVEVLGEARGIIKRAMVNDYEREVLAQIDQVLAYADQK